MKITCIPIYSIVHQNQLEFQLSTMNKSAPALFRYCIITGIDLRDVLPLKVADVKTILANGYVDAPSFAKSTPPYRVDLDKETLKRLESVCEDKTDNDFAFSFNGYIAPSYSGMQRMLDRAVKAIMPDDAEHITIYSLKKTFAFRMFQKNDSWAETMRITGHQSPSRLQKFLGLSQSQPYAADSREKLLHNKYGSALIEQIKISLDNLDAELYNPHNPDSFYQSADKNLTAFADYLGITHQG